MHYNPYFSEVMDEEKNVHDTVTTKKNTSLENRKCRVSSLALKPWPAHFKGGIANRTAH